MGLSLDLLQGCCNSPDDETILLQSCVSDFVTALSQHAGKLGQPCNKFDLIPVKFVASCAKLVDNLAQTVEHNLPTACLQICCTL